MRFNRPAANAHGPTISSFPNLNGVWIIFNYFTSAVAQRQEEEKKRERDEIDMRWNFSTDDEAKILTGFSVTG